MFAVFRDHGRFRRGEVIDYSPHTVRQWFPDWEEFAVEIVGDVPVVTDEGRTVYRRGIREDALRRYIAEVDRADSDEPAPRPKRKRAA